MGFSVANLAIRFYDGTFEVFEPLASKEMDSGSVNVDPETISTTLLNGIRAQRPQAWKRLVHIYGPLIYQWCRQAGFQPADARDIEQEVMLSVMNGVERFRRENPGHSFRGWLWVISRRRQIDFYRKRLVGTGGKSDQLLDQFPDSPPPEVNESSGEKSRILFRILNVVKSDFQENTWNAFWRTVVDGNSAANVANELKMTHVAVRQAKFRILNRLRSELEELSSI